MVGDRFIASRETERIDLLLANHLIKVAEREVGWTWLLKGPSDGRFWELSYPFGDRHGGGPPKLEVLTRAAAKALYGAAEI